MSYHVIYVPSASESALSDRLVSVIQSDNPVDVQLRLQGVPGALAMELDAQDDRECLQELEDLGFACRPGCS